MRNVLLLGLMPLLHTPRHPKSMSYVGNIKSRGRLHGREKIKWDSIKVSRCYFKRSGGRLRKTINGKCLLLFHPKQEGNMLSRHFMRMGRKQHSLEGYGILEGRFSKASCTTSFYSPLLVVVVVVVVLYFWRAKMLKCL